MLPYPSLPNCSHAKRTSTCCLIFNLQAFDFNSILHFNAGISRHSRARFHYIFKIQRREGRERSEYHPGASVLLAPYSVFTAVGLYFIVKWRFKYVSLDSMVIAFTIPLIEIILHGLTPTFYYLLICSFLIVVLHRENIIRLIKGNELGA